MPLPNSMNTLKGTEFQKNASLVLTNYYNIGFRLEYPVPIGNPPKEHKFDIVSFDLRFVGECKNYSWAEGGNVPSAKIGFINEAVFYLQHLSEDKKRFVVVRRDVDSRHTESLAEYYYRINRHLLKDVYITEIDLGTGNVREIGNRKI